MSKNQWGIFYLVVGLLAVTATLVGDLMSLWRSGGSVDTPFITGIGLHIGGVVAAFRGGVIFMPSGAGSAATVSDEKRAEIAGG